jgi:hypothetical protein
MLLYFKTKIVSLLKVDLNSRDIQNKTKNNRKLSFVLQNYWKKRFYFG